MIITIIMMMKFCLECLSERKKRQYKLMKFPGNRFIYTKTAIRRSECSLFDRKKNKLKKEPEAAICFYFYMTYKLFRRWIVKNMYVFSVAIYGNAAFRCSFISFFVGILVFLFLCFVLCFLSAAVRIALLGPFETFPNNYTLKHFIQVTKWIRCSSSFIRCWPFHFSNNLSVNIFPF